MKSKYLLLSVALGLLLSIGLLTTLNIQTGVTSAHVALAPAEYSPTAPLTSQAISTTYIIVRFGTHDTIVRPVTFTRPISAYHALERSGLAFTTADFGFGAFLCSIEDVGDSSGACNNGTQFWGTSAWNSANQRWDMRMTGITATIITEDGHIEGFSWSNPGWQAVAPPPAPPLAAAWQALTWLETQQQADGSFGAPGNTAEVLMALGANRMDATHWHQSNGATALSAMQRQGLTLANTTAGSGKLALALTSHETCWPITAMPPMDYYSTTTGAFDTGAAPHSLAMLGTAALSQTIPPSATTYLLNLQQPNGGWEWGVGWGTDTNSTALALQALIAAGKSPTSTAVISGLNYLKQAQNSDGGFPYDPASPYGTDSDTNSTAYAVQALLAVGEDPLDGTWATNGTTGTLMISGTNPIAFLLSMQLTDGSFEWQKGQGANQMATQQAATALLYHPFPIRTAMLAPCETVFLPLVVQNR